MRVLSLFDGMSCGRQALERAGIDVSLYFASEVDKHAMKVTQHNYPDTIPIGDVNNWRSWGINWSTIDILFAGFPCQAWSLAGKQGGLNDPRGELALVLSEIFEHWKTENPKGYFLFENVRMKKENLEFLNLLFGVEAVQINSALVSAQNRKRFYWTNIPNVTQPEDKGILLRDIVHEYTETFKPKAHTLTSSGAGNTANPSDIGRYFNKSIGNFVMEPFNTHPSGRGMNGNVLPVTEDKEKTLTTNKGEGNKVAFPLDEYKVDFDKTLKILDKEVEKGKVGYFRKDSQANRGYFIHNKAATLCGDAGGGAAKMGQYLFGCITPDRVNKRQNGQRFNEVKKCYTLTSQDKHGILIEGYIRKLTPTECERLQTVRDGYTEVEGVSNSQRYKMLGNGWTVDVIAHILSGINPKSN